MELKEQTLLPHNAGLTVRSIEIKVVDQTDTRRDLDATEQDIRVTDASGFNINDFIKIDNEFMQVTNAQTDTTGTVLVVLAAENQLEHMMVRDIRLDIPTLRCV